MTDSERLDWLDDPKRVIQLSFIERSWLVVFDDEVVAEVKTVREAIDAGVRWECGGAWRRES